MNNLKERTLSGLKWSAVERFATNGISFVITIIIARILIPSDYGIIGMISIFIGISNVFIEAGFSSALIRKQNRTDTDFSTVFYYNILISLLFYSLIFIGAPWISRFYNMPVLISVTRVVALNMVIGALGAIHLTKLNIVIDFKTHAKISLIALIIAGSIGILMAYKGFGVWALVTQGIMLSLMTTGLVWYFVRWKPSGSFSKTAFLELFGFGSKLMLSGLLETIYTNIYQMVIGKKYNATELGYYARANGLVQLPSTNISWIIQRVTFPVLSEIQDDTDRLANNYRRLLKMTAFIIFPLMILLAALGKPLIKVLLTDKWVPSVPLMQVLCVSFMFYPIHAINLNLLQVKGRSDLFLRLEVIKKLIITIVLFISFSYGVLAICLGTVFTSILGLIINTHYTGKIINLGFMKQMKDITPVLLISLLSGLVAYSPSLLLVNPFAQLFLGGFAGVSFFLFTAFIFKMEEMKEITSMMLNRH